MTQVSAVGVQLKWYENLRFKEKTILKLEQAVNTYHKDEERRKF
jgi:hypothetical protein